MFRKTFFKKAYIIDKFVDGFMGSDYEFTLLLLNNNIKETINNNILNKIIKRIKKAKTETSHYINYLNRLSLLLELHPNLDLVSKELVVKIFIIIRQCISFYCIHDWFNQLMLRLAVINQNFYDSLLIELHFSSLGCVSPY